MKHIKLFEAWSAKFNRTLQGASALAKSNNKGFGKAEKEVRDYAEKQISKEEFSLELENGDKLIITHDTNFLLNPISEFEKINTSKIFYRYTSTPEKQNYFFIPVKVKTYPLSDELEVPVIFFRDPRSYTKTGKGGLANSSVILGTMKTGGANNMFIDKESAKAARFSNKSGFENFIAMAIQSILSSPEKGTPIEEIKDLDEEPTPNQLGMDSFPEQMTKEKFIIINLFKNIILDKDIREFTM